MESTVIIIGGDHHNTLAAIRALGRKKCIFEIIVHDNCLTNEKVKVFKSKYAKKHPPADPVIIFQALFWG